MSLDFFYYTATYIQSAGSRGGVQALLYRKNLESSFYSSLLMHVMCIPLFKRHDVV